MADQEYENKSV